MTTTLILCIIILASGGLAERFKAPSWKGGEVQASVSSNLMSSASCKLTLRNKGFYFVYYTYIYYHNQIKLLFEINLLTLFNF